MFVSAAFTHWGTCVLPNCRFLKIAPQVLKALRETRHYIRKFKWNSTGLSVSSRKLFLDANERPIQSKAKSGRSLEESVYKDRRIWRKAPLRNVLVEERCSHCIAKLLLRRKPFINSAGLSHTTTWTYLRIQVGSKNYLKTYEGAVLFGFPRFRFFELLPSAAHVEVGRESAVT